MDFKSYTRMLLNEKKAKDEDLKAEDENIDDEEEVDDEEDEAEDEKESSVKTKKRKTCAGGCTGSEAMASVSDDDDGNEGDDGEAEDGDDDDDDDKKEKSKKKTMKESILDCTRYTYGELINEEADRAHLISESIKNGSASKFLSKMAKKSEKEADKMISKGKKEEAKVARDISKKLKEASFKIYKTEEEYKAGTPGAKAEYKRLCRQYSSELKKMGKGAKFLKVTLRVLVACAALLGLVSLTGFANADAIEQLENGVKNGNLPETLGGMAIKDKDALVKLAKGAKEGVKLTADSMMVGDLTK